MAPPSIALELLGELRLPGRGATGRAVAAGSGLALLGDHLAVVSDDAHDLVLWDTAAARPPRLVSAGRAPLPAAAAERKRHKPDLEALVALPQRPGWPRGALLALGSGSTSARREGLLWPLGEDGLPGAAPAAVDLGPLYAHLDTLIGDVNIEGAAVAGGHLVLLQRGNGRAGVNAAIALELGRALDGLARGALTPAAFVMLREHELGAVDGVRLAFTDAAALPAGGIAATAVAEAGDDTYDDGECVAAALVVLDAEGELAARWALEPAYKVEGLAAREVDGGVELLLVADADDPHAASPLLRARLP